MSENLRHSDCPPDPSSCTTTARRQYSVRASRQLYPVARAGAGFRHVRGERITERPFTGPGRCSRRPLLPLGRDQPPVPLVQPPARFDLPESSLVGEKTGAASGKRAEGGDRPSIFAVIREYLHPGIQSLNTDRFARQSFAANEQSQRPSVQPTVERDEIV